MVDIREMNALIEQHSNFVTNLTTGMDKIIVGQKHLVESLLIGLLSDGHILLEGVPGLAKTLAIKTLSNLIDGKFSRIQFTPDLLPADVIGTMIYSQKEVAFQVKKSCIRELRTCRRNKPCPGKGAECVAGIDAGASGDHRRTDLQVAGAFPRNGNTESGGAGGYIPIA